jgi:hypothetical protein
MLISIYHALLCLTYPAPLPESLHPLPKTLHLEPSHQSLHRPHLNLGPSNADVLQSARPYLELRS